MFQFCNNEHAMNCGGYPGSDDECTCGLEYRKTITSVWEALGIRTYEQAAGMTIAEHVADLKRKAGLWEKLHDNKTKQLEEAKKTWRCIKELESVWHDHLEAIDNLPGTKVDL